MLTTPRYTRSDKTFDPVPEGLEYLHLRNGETASKGMEALSTAQSSRPTQRKLAQGPIGVEGWQLELCDALVAEQDAVGEF